jgi:hypothetical protein
MKIHSSLWKLTTRHTVSEVYLSIMCIGLKFALGFNIALMEFRETVETLWDTTLGRYILGSVYVIA